MKFGGKNEGKKEGHNHSPIKHMLHMLVCCGLPILIIALLPLIGQYSPGISGALLVIAPFICPLIMIPMMIMMFKGNKNSSCCDDKNKSVEVNKSLE